MTPHDIAIGLARHLAGDSALGAAVTDLGYLPLAVYLDDDTAGRDDKAPHVVVSPARSAGGMGQDDEITIAAVVTTLDPEWDGTSFGLGPNLDDYAVEGSEAVRFDRLAEAVWQSIRRAEPGAILQGREAEWDFAGRYPLRFVGFALSYKIIHSFGEE